MTNEVRVAGVGMIPFTKPGASETYNVMGEKAALAAFEDAGLPYSAVQQVYVGYVYGDSTAGQAAVYRLGLSGVPIINVNNNCATGSSALFLARQAVQSGAVDCALALGFEEMRPGALGATFTDRPSPMGRFAKEMVSLQEMDPRAPPSSSAGPAANIPRSTTPAARLSPRSRPRPAPTRSTTLTPSSRTSSAS